MQSSTTATRFLICSSVVVLMSCVDKKNRESSGLPTPKVVEANGYIVPADKIKPPEIIPAQSTTKIPARKPTITFRQSATKFALTPQVVQLREVSVRTPGQGAYKLPKIVPITVNSFVGDLPELVEVSPPRS